ncbi:hypothetical protein [Staphylococcus xylosus]
MKKLLTVLLGSTLILGACGIGEDSKENKQLSETQKDLDKTKKELEEMKDNQETNSDNQEEASAAQEEQPTEQSLEPNETPEMVDVLRMIDAGKNVNGIVDQEGNTWTMNPGIAVGYTNPEGEKYSTGLGYKGEIDALDFNKDYDPEDEEIEFAEEPDQEVIDELQSEIDNAGLQTEMEAKQKELDDYINSFPE